MTNQLTLEQILDDFALSYASECLSIDSKCSRGVITVDEQLERKQEAYRSAMAEAKQQLSQLIAEIIGEDDYGTTPELYKIKNSVRHEQRQRAKERGIDL